jgi:putative component of membrane protein insertase Oxa1/YidC/SpoIIIJ protein YidD
MLRLYWSSLPFVCFAFVNCFGQAFTSADLELLKNYNFETSKKEMSFRPFSLSGKNDISKYNPAKILAASGLYFYQNVISKQLGSNCPYHHSCSSFSKMCISRHGLIKGMLLTGDRLTRCGQFGLKDVRYASDIDKTSKRIIDEPSFYD